MPLRSGCSEGGGAASITAEVCTACRCLHRMWSSAALLILQTRMMCQKWGHSSLICGVLVMIHILIHQSRLLVHQLYVQNSLCCAGVRRPAALHPLADRAGGAGRGAASRCWRCRGVHRRHAAGRRRQRQGGACGRQLPHEAGPRALRGQKWANGVPFAQLGLCRGCWARAAVDCLQKLGRVRCKVKGADSWVAEACKLGGTIGSMRY